MPDLVVAICLLLIMIVIYCPFLLIGLVLKAVDFFIGVYEYFTLLRF